MQVNAARVRVPHPSHHLVPEANSSSLRSERLSAATGRTSTSAGLAREHTNSDEIDASSPFPDAYFAALPANHRRTLSPSDVGVEPGLRAQPPPRGAAPAYYPEGPVSGLAVADTPPTATNLALERSEHLPHIDRASTAEPTRTAGHLTRLVEKFDEIGVEKLKAGTAATVGFGMPYCTLALRFEKKVYDSSDPFVTDDFVRHASAQTLARQTGKDVRWVTTGGVIGVGLPIITPIPIAPFVGMTVEIVPAVILGYQTTQPYALQGSAESVGGLLSRNRMLVPFTAAAARRMPAGSEVSLFGLGSLVLFLKGGPGINFGWGAFSINADLEFQLGTSLFGELRLSVRNLDGRKLVRVTIEKLKGVSAIAGAVLRFGLRFGAAGMSESNMEGIGFGTDALMGQASLGDLANALSDSHLDSSFWDRYLAQFGVVLESVKSTTSDVVSFVLDLSLPEAAEAYEELIRLDGRKVFEMSQQANSGVSIGGSAHEKTLTRDRSVSLRAFGFKLCLAQALSAERHGKVRTAAGTRYIYRNSLYQRTRHTFVSGIREISWEATSVRDTETQDPQHYFRIHVRSKERLGCPKDRERYFRFATALKIVDEDPRHHAPPIVAWWKRPFTQEDNLDCEFDIYFTQDGIEDIVAASRTTGERAYLTGVAAIEPEAAGLPIEQLCADSEALHLVDRYLSHAGSSISLGRAAPSSPELETAYHALTGRDLITDAHLVDEARTFAKYSVKLAAKTGDKALHRFFTSLGKRHGARYMHVIVALDSLAGEDGTLVNVFNVDGRGVTIHATSEGYVEGFDPALAIRSGPFEPDHIGMAAGRMPAEVRRT